MIEERVLTDFARVINSDRYQYTESDIFISEHTEEREAILICISEIQRTMVSLWFLE